MSRMLRKVAGIFALLLMVASTVFTLHLTAGDTFLMAGPKDTSTLRQSLHLGGLVFAMLAGILSSFVGQRMQTKPDGSTVSLRNEVKSVLTSGSFIGALVVAPLVFNGLYVSVSQNPQGLTDFILAYQNGFFWQSVFARVQSGQQVAH